MRTEFCEVKSRKTAKRMCPWAAIVTKVCGGFMAFESWTDCETWKNQK